MPNTLNSPSSLWHVAFLHHTWPDFDEIGHSSLGRSWRRWSASGGEGKTKEKTPLVSPENWRVLLSDSSLPILHFPTAQNTRRHCTETAHRSFACTSIRLVRRYTHRHAHAFYKVHYISVRTSLLCNLLLLPLRVFVLLRTNLSQRVTPAWF